MAQTRHKHRIMNKSSLTISGLESNGSKNTKEFKSLSLKIHPIF